MLSIDHQIVLFRVLWMTSWKTTHMLSMEYYTLENHTLALDELKKQCSRDQMLTDLQDIKSNVATLQSITDSVPSVINAEESDPSLIVRSLAMPKNNASSMGENLMTSERQRIESPFVDSYHNPSTYVISVSLKTRGIWSMMNH